MDIDNDDDNDLIDDTLGEFDDPDSNEEPLKDLAQEVEERQEDEEVWDSFEEREVEEIDDLWDRIENDDDETTDPSTDEDRIEEVPKADYCAGCPHLSDPTEMECTHEGTEILQLVDVETVRVRNCPVVEQRETITELE
ncbi:MAG: hypothetical protein ABEJ48_02685 [Halobacteriales archaeon]